MNSVNKSIISKSWYAVYTKSRHEKCVYDMLRKKGIESSLPMKAVYRQWSDRKKKVHLPMFRGYVFVKINLNIDKLNVLKTEGVVKFIHFNNQIPTIPEKQIFWVNTLLTSESIINYETKLITGTEVEVIVGPFKGLKGKVIKQQSTFRVALWIDIIMQGISVEINPAYLKEAKQNKIVSSAFNLGTYNR